MGHDTQDAVAFYRSPRGQVAQHMVRARLAQLWPDLSRQSVLGLGFTAPYLTLWRATAERCVAAGPPQPGMACVVEEEALPLADLSMDRILMVHGLENAGNARRMLREAWRVLKDDGRLIVVAPNRLGMWAHVEATPFGQGQPYSPGQLGRLLASSLFRVERRDHALYAPPVAWAPVLRSATLIERIGRRAMPRFAGLTISEAVKDLYAAVPLRRGIRRRVVLREAA